MPKARKLSAGGSFISRPMYEPSHGYSIDELHAYAKAKNYSDEAEALHHYLRLRRRRERRTRLGALLRVHPWERAGAKSPRRWMFLANGPRPLEQKNRVRP